MNGYSWIPVMMDVIGGMASYEGSRIAGQGAAAGGALAQTEAAFEAQQLRQQADNVVGASQLEAIDIKRQVALVNSRAMAVAAAGGGAKDPTVMRLIANNAAFGAFNAASAVYSGESRARTMRLEATAKEITGNVAAATGLEKQSAYNLAANVALTKTASSVYGKYGVMPKTAPAGGTPGSTDTKAGYFEP